jgi:transposase
MTPRRARAPSGVRAISVVPYTRSNNVSVLTAMRADGVVAWNAYDGAVNEERFLAFIQDKLAPTLRPGDVLVLDNVRFHHAAAVKTCVEARGARLEFIPAYHPELNANEELFSFLKNALRRQKPRTIVELVERMKAILDGVGFARLSAFIRHALTLAAQPS